MRTHVRAFASLALLAIGPLAHAAEAVVATDGEDEALDEIVVVANKAERRLRDVAATVTVLTREKLADDLSMSLGESFRYTPGIDEEWVGGRFGSEGINIRGIGGNRVALVVDGVKLGDQFQIGSFSNATHDFIDAGFVQRTEVLHGPASALYGSDAIGGVVAVRTIAPGELTGGRGIGGVASANYQGADDSLHGRALAAFGDAARGVVLGASLRDGGVRDSAALSNPLDEREFRRLSALLGFATDSAEGQSFSFGMLYQHSKVESDLKSMLGAGRFASTTALEGDDDSRLAVAHGEVGFGSPGAFVDAGILRLYAGNSKVDQHTLDVRNNAPRPVVIARRFEYEQAFHGFEVNLQRDCNTASVIHRLGAGIEYRRTRTEEQRDGTETGIADGIARNSVLGEEFPVRDFPVSHTDEWGFYVEDTMRFRKVSVIASLRADRYELSPHGDAIYVEDNPAVAPVSLDESDLSPKLGLIWHAADAVDLYLQYAHGFRAPPFEDANIGFDIALFKYRAIPNPELQSETSDGWDAGLRIRGERGYLNLALFRTDYQDFIESKVRIGFDAASDRVLFQSRNLGEARIGGIEGSLGVFLPGLDDALSIDGSFYLARSENGDNGEPLNTVGPAQAVLGVTWRAQDERRQVRLAARLTEAWTERDESAGELFEPPGHAILDLLFSQAIGERGVVRAGLMNLTDRSWWQWTAVRGLAPDDPLLPHLAQPGRNLSIGLEWNW